MNPKIANAGIILSCTSLFVNIVITSLIIGRIVYFIRAIRRSRGAFYSSQYKHIISMLVESAALIMFFTLAYVVLTYAMPTESIVSSPGKEIPAATRLSIGGLIAVMNLIHVYVRTAVIIVRVDADGVVNLMQVIANCLIIYRVAQGRAWSSIEAPSEHSIAILDAESTGGAPPIVIQLEFAQPETSNVNLACSNPTSFV